MYSMFQLKLEKVDLGSKEVGLHYLHTQTTSSNTGYLSDPGLSLMTYGG